MKKTQTGLLLACFGGGDQSELIREIDSHGRGRDGEVNQETALEEISCFTFNGIIDMLDKPIY